MLRTIAQQWKTLSLIALLSTAAFFSYKGMQEDLSERERYARYLKEQKLDPRSATEGKDPEHPGPAVQQNFLATMDPDLKRPTPEVLPKVRQRIQKINSDRSPGESGVPWVERGPKNVGGRTRAIMFDPNDPNDKKVWAGAVTGGLWYTNDITSSDSSWHKVNDFWDNLAVSCIASDPNDPKTFYVGTGEDFYAGSSRGAGIWKTTNGGTSWSQLSSTTDFYYVNDIIVRNEGGTSVLYAAVSGANYQGVYHTANEGLQRSTDAGSSWTQVMPDAGNGNPYGVADLELAKDNRIWAGTQANSASGTDVEDRGGGHIFWSDNGTTWSGNAHNPSPTNSRVEIATAPSDKNYVYAIMAGPNLTDVDNMLYTNDQGSSWNSMNQPDDADDGIPSTDFSRGQAFYDLIIQVDPNDPNTVIAGAINLHRSTNNGSTWSQISKWSNNPSMGSLNCSKVHADQHQILFRNGNSNEAVFGTDGGVFYTSSLGTAASSDVIERRTKGYNVTQYYACAIHPDSAMNEYIAGSQDNGTQRYLSPGMDTTQEILGGDGAYNFYDQDQPNYLIASIYYNRYYLYDLSNGISFVQTLQSDQSSGDFINAADYDDQQNILYSGKDDSKINMIRNVISGPNIDSFSIPGMNTLASAFKVSPYTTSSTTLFVGTEAGRLFKVKNADSGSPTITEITGGSFPNGTISCVEVGQNENELIAIFSNYGVSSVWYSNDGGSSWSDKEGDLNNMPVRWALFNPNNYNEVVLATELGVWRTEDLSAASPSWIPSNSGLAHVRVDMLRKRTSDDQVIAATHGRGLFSSSFFPACTAPSSQPNSLVLGAVNPSQIDGHFDTSSSGADGYLVVRSTSSSLSSNPSDGTNYSNGDALGGGTVIKASSDTSFSSSGLNDGTTYYFHVFAYNGKICSGGPAYNSSSPLQGTETTPTLCTAPSYQANSLTLNSLGSSQIDGHFDTASSGADGYLVVRSTNNSLSSNPSAGTSYNSGDGLGGGTVVKATADTSFSSTGLNAGTTYHFFVFAYDSVGCSGGPAYKTPSLKGQESTPLPPCKDPTDQASSLILNAVSNSQIDGHFDSSGTGADGFLVVRSTSSSLSVDPTDGTAYASGDALGGGTVVKASSDTSFSASGLNDSTTYYFFVFAYNDSNCSNGPAYNTSGSLTGNETTLTPCTAPSDQADSLILNAVSSSSIDGHFDTAMSGANGYLTVRSTNASLSSMPNNGTSYSNGDALGGGNVVKSGSDTSFTATSLTPNTLYYFYVFAFNDTGCSGGPAYETPALTSHEATERTDAYCAAIAHPGSGEHIKRVSLNNIDNTSGQEPKGFGDYSNLSTELSKNNSYSLEVTIDTDGNSTDHVFAYIDWDQDQDFQQSSEHFDLGEVTNATSAVLTSNISIPSSGDLGSTFMRIVQSRGSDPTPCMAGFDGEVEDYSVKVVERSSIKGLSDGKEWNLYPNPNDGTFKLEAANPDRKKIEYSVIGPKGDRILHEEHGKKPLERSVSLDQEAASGNYMLRLKVGSEIRTQKFLIE